MLSQILPLRPKTCSKDSANKPACMYALIFVLLLTYAPWPSTKDLPSGLLRGTRDSGGSVGALVTRVQTLRHCQRIYQNSRKSIGTRRWRSPLKMAVLRTMKTEMPSLRLRSDVAEDRPNTRSKRSNTTEKASYHQFNLLCPLLSCLLSIRCHPDHKMAFVLRVSCAPLLLGCTFLLAFSNIKCLFQYTPIRTDDLAC
jgi:hypothetical protein